MNAAGSLADEQMASPALFDLWAGVYDQQTNPFLSLEQRVLAEQLPNLDGLDVLDAGCGTGRLLPMLKALEPKTLIGFDSSREMIRRASSRNAGEVRFGSCLAMPIEKNSVDCVVSSFVLSYLPSLSAFAAELARVVREGATVWLSDMHPKTAKDLGWRRSFRAHGDEMSIAWQEWSIAELCQVFELHGFCVVTCLEPSFASPEVALFQAAGKSLEIVPLRETPAIYLLGLRRLSDSHMRGQPTDMTLRGGRWALGGENSSALTVEVRKGTIDKLLNVGTSGIATTEVDLDGCIVLPGFLNAHDHLEFGLFPRLGYGPYSNATEWASDIHQQDAEVISLHRKIAKEDRVWWGAIRNLLSGVTTVCHHNPILPVMLQEDFPVRVMQEFTWAHSLGVDGGRVDELLVRDPSQPFIIHAGEGTDEESALEMTTLDQLGMLTSQTVLVHGLALSEGDVRILNSVGGALVVCPSTNQFLLGSVHSKSLLQSVARLALGTDSSLTATGDLIDEIAFANERIGLAPDMLYRMVTTQAASVLGLSEGEGRIRVGGRSDFVGVRDRGLSPADTLCGLGTADIIFVMRSGVVFLASEAFYERLDQATRAALAPLTVDSVQVWIRAPLMRLFAAAAPVMNGEVLRLAGKRLVYGHRA